MSRSMLVYIMPRVPRACVRLLAKMLKAAMRFGAPHRDTLLWAELDRWLMAETYGDGRQERQ